MPGLKKLFAICGSTRAASSNLVLLHAIAELVKDKFDMEMFTDIAGIPAFNPDLDNDDLPIAVVSFRDKLRSADAIIICTPEYAMGVPGTLKNAIDWTVSSMEFSNKPTALITASSSGVKAHQSLLETLRVIEANIIDETQLLISFIKTKLAADGTIKDTATFDQVRNLLNALYEL